MTDIKIMPKDYADAEVFNLLRGMNVAFTYRPTKLKAGLFEAHVSPAVLEEKLEILNVVDIIQTISVEWDE